MRGSHGNPTRPEHYIQQAVVQLLILRLQAGATSKEMEEFLASCVSEASRRPRSAPASVRRRGLDIHRLGSVLRAWHTQTDYLTEDGLPRPLPIAGRDSLSTLVRKFYPANKVRSVIAIFRSSGLIKKQGRHKWSPTSRHARISHLSHETLEHLAEGIAKYVQTVTANVTARSENDVLFERSCKVTRIPSREFQAFRRFVADQSVAFITAMDDWLEARARGNLTSNRRCTTAGVYTFAYFDEEAQPKRVKGSH